MKKIIFMALLMPSLVFANPQTVTKQIMCINGEDLSKTVDEFKELPFVRGISTPIEFQDARLSLVVFANPTSGTFTIVERTSEDLYCILAVGGNFEPVPKEIQDNSRIQQEKRNL